MPHIIRDAEFKNYHGRALWPGMWVFTCSWGFSYIESSPLNACFLWRIEQHDGVMMLAGQGVDVLVPLTHELVDSFVVIDNPACEMLALWPDEWAALRQLGWGIHLGYYSNGSNLRHRFRVYCQRRHTMRMFFLADKQEQQLREYPQILRTFLQTTLWRLKHPKYADALAGDHPREFWDWPNVPETKQLHQMGLAAWMTAEGRVEIGPDGTLKATGRKRWDFPAEGEEAE